MAVWSVYTLIYTYRSMNVSVSISSILVSQASKRTGFFSGVGLSGLLGVTSDTVGFPLFTQLCHCVV